MVLITLLDHMVAWSQVSERKEREGRRGKGEGKMALRF
jgi:hypothetical protein